MSFFSRQRLISGILLIAFLIIGCDSSDDSNNQGIVAEAQRIRSVAKLIEGVARQPEIEPELLQQHDALTQNDGSYVEATDCQLIEARLIAFGKYIESAARQPEAETQLKDIFDNYAGSLSPEVIAPCENALYMRNIVVAYLIAAINRQPEMADTLHTRAAEYIGEFADYPAAFTTTPLVLAGRAQLVGPQIEQVARNPEAADVIEEIVALYAGDKSLIVDNTDCIVNTARINVLSYLTENTARQPELFLELDGCVGDSCGMLAGYFNEQAGSIETEGLRGNCILPLSLNFDL